MSLDKNLLFLNIIFNTTFMEYDLNAFGWSVTFCGTFLILINKYNFLHLLKNLDIPTNMT